MHSGTSTTTRRPTGGPDRRDVRPRRRAPGRHRLGRSPDRPAGRRPRLRRGGRHPRAASPTRGGQQGLPGREARPGHLGQAAAAARHPAEDHRGRARPAQTARSARSPAWRTAPAGSAPMSALLNSNTPEGFMDRAAALDAVAANEDRVLRDLLEHQGPGQPHPGRPGRRDQRTAQAGRGDGQAQGAGRTGPDRGHHPQAADHRRHRLQPGHLQPPTRRPRRATPTAPGRPSRAASTTPRRPAAASPRAPCTRSTRPRPRASPGTSPATAPAAPANTRRAGPATSRRRRAASAATPPAATRRTATTWPRTSSATPTGSPCST